MDRREARKEKRREQAREDILDAAREVILQKGLAGFTLAAVAREVQLTKAALYYYFASKEELVFELIYVNLKRHADVVAAAVRETESGAAALEALIRSAAAHYGAHKDELRLGYLVPQVGTSRPLPTSPEHLTRIRPFNDQMYGAVAERIRSDQEAGRIDPGVDGRRLAFVAHTSVMGMIVMEGLIERADDAPLIHSHDAMVDELVASFTARLTVT